MADYRGSHYGGGCSPMNEKGPDQTERLRAKMNERGYDVVKLALSPGLPRHVFIHRICGAVVWNPDVHDNWHSSLQTLPTGD